MLFCGLIAFWLGVSAGSFLNCVVYRLNLAATSQESRQSASPLRGIKSFLLGRSFCPQCKHQLSWKDNIPLLSFLFLHGRCRYCQKKISLQHPLVELATGLLFVLIFLYFETENLLILLFYGFLTASLIAIFVSDLLYFTIPDEVVYPAIIVTGIAHLFYRPTVRGVPAGHLGGGTVTAVLPFLLTGLVAALFFIFLVWVTRGRGMGWGDVKLAALMGLFLGFPKIIIALYLAFLTGALVGVILILLKKKQLGEKIPFGPFLAGGAIFALFWGEKIWQSAVLLW